MSSNAQFDMWDQCVLVLHTQVRRKADGAKNLVKEWLTDWRDSPLVTQDPSHSQIQGTCDIARHAQRLMQAMRVTVHIADAAPAKPSQPSVTKNCPGLSCCSQLSPKCKVYACWWPGRFNVTGSPNIEPHAARVTATIQELGQFYMKNGQRARLPSTTGQELLHRLDAAAIALPLP